MRCTSRIKLIKLKEIMGVNFSRSFSGYKNGTRFWDKVPEQIPGAKHDPAQCLGKREQLP